MRYAKPKSLDEAIALLGEGRWRMLAGGTDFYPAQGARPLRDNVLDLNGLGELRHITAAGDAVVLGARATWSDVLRAPLPPAFEALRQAAREVGSIQIQNAGTVAGNLCNASPAADGVPPLLALDAEVELVSTGGTRLLPLDRFLLGNRKTALLPGELMTAIRIPRPSVAGRSQFVKLGARRYLVISIAMAAVRVVMDERERIAQAAIAVGACSAVARRLAGLERRLMGIEAGDGVSEAVSTHDFAELSPIDDVRAPAGYRREAARELVTRALAAACGISEERTEAAA
jgi:CO/xanthine dehydrogenase FAD-binding subunit